MKKGKGLVIVIVILSIFLLSAIGYILYDKDVFNLKDKDINSVESEELTLNEINKLHDSLIIGDVDLYNETDKDKLVTIDSIGPEQLYYYALLQYVEDNNISIDKKDLFQECGGGTPANKDIKFCKTVVDENGSDSKVQVSSNQVITISNADIQKKIKELFGVDKVYELKDRKEFSAHSDVKFIYSKAGDKFWVLRKFGDGEHYVRIGNNMLNYEQKDDSIVFYDKVVRCMGVFCYKSKVQSSDGLVLVGSSKAGTSSIIDIKDFPDLKMDEEIRYYKIYADKVKGYSKEYSIDDFESVLDFDYIFENYSDLFYTYKTTFKKHDDGKYYWYSSEIVNS